MPSPAWISAIIGLITVIFAAGVTWGVITFKVSRIEQDNEKLSTVIEALKDTIREEFAKVSKRISTLLFEESGTSRYLPRSEFLRVQGDCRADLARRVERLEVKAHDHKEGKP